MTRRELSHIVQNAQKIMQESQIYCLSQVINTPPVQSQKVFEYPIRRLDLRPPESYLLSMQCPNLPASILDHCSRALQDLARITQDAYERTVRHEEMLTNNPDTQPPEKVIEVIRRIFEDDYHKRCLERVQIINQCVMQRLAGGKYITANKDRKPTFNHNFTPLLEQYFEHNAYPSSSDKALLAKRTGMTQRQIDVWFQNHRNRAKKDGRALRRPLDVGSPAELAVDFLDTNIPCPAPHLASSVEHTDAEESDSDSPIFSGRSLNFNAQSVVNIPQKRRCVILDNSATPIPPHVFPTPYRQATQRNQLKFPPTTWERRPCHKVPRDSIDIEELISLFALKLIIGSRDSNASRRRMDQRISNHNATWFESRITITPTAPLPALQRARSFKKSLSIESSMQASSQTYETRWPSISGQGPGPIRSYHRPRPGFITGQRRKSSASSSSSSSSGTSDEASSGNELLTPPIPTLRLPETPDKITLFDMYGWGSEP